MKFILGFKQEMTQKYREDGRVVPVTVVKVDRCVVTQIKTDDRDGYSAIQLGVGKKNKAGKTMSGHISQFIKLDQKPFAKLREVRLEGPSEFKVGDSIAVTMFEPGDKISVTGVSKGKGFQGVVKRHGFKGSPASHGHKDQLRMPGSIGPQEPQRVFKGTRMGGRMGSDQITIKNLEVISVDPENSLLFVKGALPGARNSLVVLVGEGEGKAELNLFDAPVKEEKPVEEDKPVEEAAPEAKAEETKEEKVDKEAKKDKPEVKASEAKEDNKVTEEDNK